MRKVFLLLCLGLMLYAQDSPVCESKSSMGFMYGIDAGMLKTFSDYKTAGSGLIARAIMEDYFLSRNNFNFGFRVSYGYGHAAGKDGRYDIPEFKNNFISISGMLMAARREGRFMPYAGAGLLLTSGKTKDGTGNEIEAAKDWGSSIIGEAGTRYFLQKNLALSFGIAFYLYNDLLDGRETGSFPDYSMACNVGIMYSPGKVITWHLGSRKQADTLPEGLFGGAANVQLSKLEIAYKDSLEKAYEKLSPEEKKQVKKNIGSTIIYRAFAGVDDFAGTPSDSILLAGVYEEITGRQFSEFLKDNEQPGIEEEIAGEKVIDKEATNVHVYDVKAEEAIVYFEPGCKDIARTEYVKLDRLIDLMKENPKEQWCIEAYTDSIEAKENCKTLAVERAYLVRGYFVRKGIAETRFHIVVKRENEPAADNSTEEGRAYNRRVKVTGIE